MSNPTDGGPAFPRTAHERYYDDCGHGPQDGMSLRDWFAGQAMAGLLHDNGYDRWDYLAEDAYRVADAMLKEREATREQ